tara:strand:+ start:48 stop:299 length:252 start_codon:yes stop_codon:yes gene_type:complete
MTKKSILDTIIEARKGMYCHVIEVSDTYEIDNVVEMIHSEYNHTHTNKEIFEFLNSLEVYCLERSNEEEIYNYDFKESLEYCN